MPIIGGGGSGSSGSGAGSEIGYDQATGAVSVASSTEATGTTLITCAAHTFDGSAALATFYCPLFQFGTNTSVVTAVSLFEGAVQLGRLLQAQSLSASPSMGIPLYGFLRFTPSAASHTYTVTVFSTNVAATAPSFNPDVGGTGARVAMFIRFTKV